MPEITTPAADESRYTTTLDRVRRQEPGAIDELLKKATDRATRIAQFYLRGSWPDATKACDAEDLTQIVSMTIIRRFHEDPVSVSVNTGQFHSFLEKLTERAARDIARQVRGPKFQVGNPSARYTDYDDPAIAAPADPIERRIEDRETLQRLIEQLSEADQFLVHAHLTHGFSHAEIAMDLGLSVDAVRQRFVRAIQKLRKIAEPSSGTDERGRKMEEN